MVEINQNHAPLSLTTATAIKTKGRYFWLTEELTQPATQPAKRSTRSSAMESTQHMNHRGPSPACQPVSQTMESAQHIRRYGSRPFRDEATSEVQGIEPPLMLGIPAASVETTAQDLPDKVIVANRSRPTTWPPVPDDFDGAIAPMPLLRPSTWPPVPSDEMILPTDDESFGGG